MNKRQSNSINPRSETAISYKGNMSYGVASGVSMAPRVSEPVSLSLIHYINFYFCEYFKGFMFVILTSVFIFAVPGIWMRRGALRLTMTDFLKRSMDIIGAVIGLLLTSPLWLILPIVIKLSSPGPVFYTQTRLGKDTRKNNRRVYQKADSDDRRGDDRRKQNLFGRPFKLIKFRTMVNDAEKKTGAVWAVKNDPRITRLGRIMRKTRLDEIPQFLNVLIGDMSLVGPRPERPEFVEKLVGQIDNYQGRLAVKPGITGLAQVESGYDASIETVAVKVDYDLKYIKNKSIWLDIKILFKTVFVVLTGKGAN